MKRGDVVVVALQGDYGKPRPALMIQSDLFGGHSSICIAPITSTVVDAPLFRITVERSSANGLRTISQIMVDKVTTIRRDRVARVAGRLEEDVMQRVNRALALWFGIAS